MNFERDQIEQHINYLHYAAERAGRDGKLVLAAFGQDPDTGENLPPAVSHFKIGDVDGMVNVAMGFENVPHRNVYAPFALMRSDLPEGQKGTEDDVVASLALVVDADADHGKTPPQSPMAPNYVIESSNGNFQQILFLDRPLPAEEAKPMAAALRRATGDKSASDISHVWRVPGCLNWPNRKKVHDRGRPRNPQPVTIRTEWKTWTAVDDLRATLKPHWHETENILTGPTPSAVDGVSHDGIRYNELVWWITKKTANWTSGAETLSNDDWISLGKRIKLSFPGEDGLKAFLAMSWADQHDTVTRRWWNTNDFKIEGENLETLPALLRRDINWMFRATLGCPQSPLGESTQIPAEVLDLLKREREQYDAALLGPLPNYPELTFDQACALAKFWAHLPSGKMIYEGTREMWTSGSLDKHIGRIRDVMKTTGPGMLASTWLSQHQAVQSMGWAPGEPMIIEGRVLTNEGWLRSAGDRTFNRYVPPDIAHVEGDVSRWLNHIKFVYPNEWQHIVSWFAHRVQRPGEKVNHCLDFIGPQGIGKDTITEPVIIAIGKHNFQGIAADVFYNSDYNDFLQSVILRLDEVHDLGGESRYGFYDKTKTIITAPPTTHRINVKYVPQYSALNVCGVIMTSNHLDALYISQDDRRHFVCVSSRTKEEFSESYWTEMYRWFAAGGNEAVSHYLANLDISEFNAKAPPPKTAGWHMVVTSGLAPESSDLSDVIETLGKPDALTLPMIKAKTPTDSQLRLSFEDAKLRRVIPKRLAEVGYIAVANPDARDSGGRWRVPGGKTTIYAKQTLSVGDREAAARLLSSKAS